MSALPPPAPGMRSDLEKIAVHIRTHPAMTDRAATAVLGRTLYTFTADCLRVLAGRMADGADGDLLDRAAEELEGRLDGGARALDQMAQDILDGNTGTWWTTLLALVLAVVVIGFAVGRATP